MATEHNTITDPEIHEPKGASTALAGQVYVSNGAASGSWGQIEDLRSNAPAGAVPRVSNGTNRLVSERVHGWAQFQDSRTTSGSPAQTISAGATANFVCDGGFLTKTMNPSDISVPMWDTLNNKHVPIAEDDLYILRISFTAQGYSGTDPYLDLELDIGGAVGVIYATSVSLRKSGGAQEISWAFPVFTGSTYTPNGGVIKITYNGTGSCNIYKNSILIVRESKNYL